MSENENEPTNLHDLYGKLWADAEEEARQRGEPWPPEQPKRCRNCRNIISWKATPYGGGEWVHVFDKSSPMLPCKEARAL